MIMTTNTVYVDATCESNPYSLIPYVNDNGEIWLAAQGNGCADDIMLEDIDGLSDADIADKWGEIDLDALRADADEIEAAGDADNADWIRSWCDRCAAARHNG